MNIVKRRQASVALSAGKFYRLISDLRNFRQMLPGDMKDNYRSDEDSCVFTIAQIGSVNIQVAEREPDSRVLFKGNAVSRIDIELEVSISNQEINTCKADLVFTAGTDQITGMLLSSVIDRFLDRMVEEIENFRYHDSDSSKENPLP